MEINNRTKWCRNEGGAIDLASIMVGIIVIGLIGGTIAATIFAVIPWTQDNAAKQQLGSVMQAENAYMGLSSTVPSSLPAGLAANSFGNSADLETAGLLKQGTNYCASTVNTGSKGYEGYAKSDSGQIFIVSDKNTSPISFTGTLPSNCTFLGSSGSSAPVAYIDPTPTITTLTYNCPTTTTGSIPMKTALTGKETWSGGMTSTATYSNAATATSKTLNAGVTYQVTFDGTYSAFNSSATGLGTCLRSVDYWGSNTGVTDATSAFYNATNLTNVPAHIPTTITNMYQLFYGASKINDPNISNWDITNVVNISSIFANATSFNQPLNNWNTSNVSVMGSAFYQASKFNQPLDNWKTSKVTDMWQIFYCATAFNQPINTWDTSNVTKMEHVFWGAASFNQPLNNWDTSKVTLMPYMFSGATHFNQPLNNWDTSHVTNMDLMFNGTSVFDQNIKYWNVSKVTSAISFRAGSALSSYNSPF